MKKNIFPTKIVKMAYFGFLSGQSILIWARNTLSMIAPLTYVIKKCKTSRKSTILKIWFLFEASWNNKKHKNSNISIKTQDFVLKMSGNYFSWVLGRTLPYTGGGVRVTTDGTYQQLLPWGGVVIFGCNNWFRVITDDGVGGSRVIFALEVIVSKLLVKEKTPRIGQFNLKNAKFFAFGEISDLKDRKLRV